MPVRSQTLRGAKLGIFDNLQCKPCICGGILLYIVRVGGIHCLVTSIEAVRKSPVLNPVTYMVNFQSSNKYVCVSRLSSGDISLNKTNAICSIPIVVTAAKQKALHENE